MPSRQILSLISQKKMDGLLNEALNVLYFFEGFGVLSFYFFGTWRNQHILNYITTIADAMEILTILT